MEAKDIKCLLKLNYFKDLSLLNDSQLNILKDQNLLEKYEKNVFILPKNFCVVHHKEVVDYILFLENGANTCNWREDLTLFSHFSFNGNRCVHRGCSYDTRKDYTEISIEDFRKHVYNKNQ